ncbi:hypothetical protein POM88_006069 [Heracleum sosnowskyi]|uniref:Major facilitator superfamily (MFS) profile domain-containing protein n=1 Tax=Heracleum sosnowskyi TaxID=360622 RepID=A0AAD8J4R5_9APIA|nr:hypothetical protein POM88_006069 [Heracleum sosnowskyi]
MTGSDAILLGAETLRGLYPVETISIVGKICAEVEILSILRESEDSDLENGIVGLSQKEMEEETESFYPEFTPASFFHGLVKSGRKQLPKLVVGLLLAGSAVAFYATRNERVNQILQQTEITSTSIDEVSENPRRVAGNILCSGDCSSGYWKISNRLWNGSLLLCGACAFIIDRAGRKPLLLASASGLVLGCLITGLSFYLKTYEIGLKAALALAVTGILVYIGYFSIGMGSVPWVVMFEIFDINIKGAGGSLATLVNWFGA